MFKKITKIALVSTMVLGVGSAALTTTPATVSAATIISETTREQVIIFDHSDLEEATSIQLSSANVQKMYSKLTEKASWTNLGYSAAESKKIAARFFASHYQALGILRDMAKNESLELKVVLVNTPYYSGVNIGTKKMGTTPTKPTKPETNPGNEQEIDSEIKEIEIDIEYKKKEIELDLDVKSNGQVKATYKNEFTGEKIQGGEAETIIMNALGDLDLATASQETIANQVVSALGANKDYKKFAFKVKYFDKTQVKFKIK